MNNGKQTTRHKETIEQRSQDVSQANDAAERDEKLIRRMQRQAEADTQLIGDLRGKEQDHERLRQELDALKKSKLCDACQAALAPPPSADADPGQRYECACGQSVLAVGGDSMAWTGPVIVSRNTPISDRVFHCHNCDNDIVFPNATEWGSSSVTVGEKSPPASAQEVGDQARPVIGVDLGAGQASQVKQSTLSLECPAGCSHVVLLPNSTNVTVEDIITAYTEAGVDAWQTEDGALTFRPHQPTGCSSVTVGESVKTAAEYSADITDPLKTAREELDLIIRLDGDKAWDAAGGAAFGSPREERDHYISALEMFMAAMLKWAQGREQCRVDAVKLLPGDIDPNPLTISTALAVMLGHPDINSAAELADTEPKGD